MNSLCILHEGASLSLISPWQEDGTSFESLILNFLSLNLKFSEPQFPALPHEPICLQN
jgi:hypothetical protein